VQNIQILSNYSQFVHIFAWDGCYHEGAKIMDKKGYGMMKKLWCLLLCAMFVLTGCSSNTTGTADSETETNQTADVEEEGPSMEEQAAEPLTVYLNDFDSVIPDLFKEKTGYDVEVVVGNGAETMSRIEAEKSNPQWDVVWMDSMYDIYNLDLGGQLMTDVEIENASGLTPEFSALVPEDKCFYPTGAHSAGVLVYRNDVWSEEDAPKSYADLTDPKYAGAVAMADPGVAAPAYPLAAYFMDTLGMEGGQEFFTTLFEQGLKVYPKNPQVVEALASGEATIAMLQESNAYAMIADGEPITIVWPEEGAAASTRVAAICKSTDQPDIAKAFVEFLLDPEVQQELIDTGDEAYFTPSVEGVTAKPDREPNPTLVAADVQFGAENEADIKAWFADYSAQ
jgi:hypothetical protein